MRAKTIPIMALSVVFSIILISGSTPAALAGTEFSSGSCTCTENGQVIIADFFCFVGTCAEMDALCEAQCGGINETSCNDLSEPNEFCPDIVKVGGELIPIETTSLLVAGAQSFSWMIPLVLSAIGIGLFAVSRKSINSRMI